MAAPSDVTIKDLSGVWVMNKELTGSNEDIFLIQNLGWMLRKTLGLATITLSVKHYTESGVEKIDIDQTLTGGLKGTTENRILDWTDREHTDHVFGTVLSKSHRVLTPSTDDLLSSNPHFTTGWTADTLEHGLIVTRAVNEKEQWAATQVWGFSEEVKGDEGKRRYVRRIRIEGTGSRSGKVVEKVLVYDYVGKLPEA